MLSTILSVEDTDLVYLQNLHDISDLWHVNMSRTAVTTKVHVRDCEPEFASEISSHLVAVSCQLVLICPIGAQSKTVRLMQPIRSLTRL